MSSFNLPSVNMTGLGTGTAVGGGGGANPLSLLGMMGGPWGMALSFAPALFSLFGGDPQRRMRHELANMFTPENIRAWGNANLRTIGADPNTNIARAGIIQSGNTLSNELAKSFGARGLGTTGIAAAALPIARSATGARMAQFEGNLQQQAMQMALAQLQQRAAALTGNPYGQSRFQAGLDKSFGALLPILQAYLKQRMGVTQPMTYGGLA